MGFFPYENPKFAFVVMMEDGPKVTVSAVHAFRPVLDYIAAHPEVMSE
jgi:cell division protein FtsI/penicillin-binding protein 2